MQNANFRPNTVMKTLILAVALAGGFGGPLAGVLSAPLSAPLLVPFLGNDYAFYVGAEACGAFVELHEWVLDCAHADCAYADCAHAGDKISAIDYNTGFNGGFRLVLGFEPYNKLTKAGLGISGVYSSYLPASRGTVSDRDWDDDGFLFSLGNGTANSIAFTDIEGKLQLYIPLGKIPALVLTAKLWYCRYSVTANDGWIQQAGTGEPWDVRLPKKPLYGMSMMYIQEWLTVAPGLGLWLQLGRHSIYLYGTVWGGVWGYHLDYHYFRNVIYQDTVKGNLTVCVEAEWKYRVKSYGEIGLTLGYKAIPDTKGSSHIMTTGLTADVYYPADAAGASLIQIYGGISCKLWL